MGVPKHHKAALCVYRYLHVAGQSFGRPIQGQMEISGVKEKTKSNLWKAMEGVYMEPVDDKNNL